MNISLRYKQNTCQDFILLELMTEDATIILAPSPSPAAVAHDDATRSRHASSKTPEADDVCRHDDAR